MNLLRFPKAAAAILVRAVGLLEERLGEAVRTAESAIGESLARVESAAAVVTAFLDALAAAAEARVSGRLLRFIEQEGRLLLAVAGGALGVFLLLAAVRNVRRFIRRFRRASAAIGKKIEGGAERFVGSLRRELFSAWPRRIRDALERAFVDVSVALLDRIWGRLQGRPEFFDRDRIRENAARTAAAVSSFLEPLTGRLGRFFLRFGGGAVWKDIAGLMREGRDGPEADLPAALAAAIDSADIGRPHLPADWLAVVEDALKRRAAGAPANLIISGDGGSGKTSLLSHIAETFPGRVRRLDPVRREGDGPGFRGDGEPGSRDADGQGRRGDGEPDLSFLPAMAEADAGEAGSPEMIVVDNLEHLFLRTPGGFDVIEKLLVAAQRTGGSVMWVCACGRPFLQFLENLYPVYSCFPLRIDMDRLDAAELARIYDKKLSDAGYSYKVIPDRATYKKVQGMKRRHALTDAGIGPFLKRQFFASLTEKGGSGFMFLNRHFAHAVSGVSGSTALVRLPVKPLFDAAGVRDFPLEDLLILQTLYIHKSLAPGELAGLLLAEENQVRLRLGVLRECGVVAEEAGVFRVNPLVYKPVYDALHRKNLFG